MCAKVRNSDRLECVALSKWKCWPKQSAASGIKTPDATPAEALLSSPLRSGPLLITPLLSASEKSKQSVIFKNTAQSRRWGNVKEWEKMRLWTLQESEMYKMYWSRYTHTRTPKHMAAALCCSGSLSLSLPLPLPRPRMQLRKIDERCETMGGVEFKERNGWERGYDIRLKRLSLEGVGEAEREKERGGGFWAALAN